MLVVEGRIYNSYHRAHSNHWGNLMNKIEMTMYVVKSVFVCSIFTPHQLHVIKHCSSSTEFSRNSEKVYVHTSTFPLFYSYYLPASLTKRGNEYEYVAPMMNSRIRTVDFIAMSNFYFVAASSPVRSNCNCAVFAPSCLYIL